MSFKAICEEYKSIFNESIALKDFGVYIYTKDGNNNIERKYFETKADAIKYAKDLCLENSRYIVKVFEHTDSYENRGFTKLLWCNCDSKKNESLLADGVKALASFNPITAAIAQNAPQLQNTVTDATDAVKSVARNTSRAIRKTKRLTSDFWQDIKKKLQKRP